MTPSNSASASASASASQLWLRVLSPERLLFEGAVRQVTLPGSKGRFTVLPQHAPLLSSLIKGSLSFVACSSPESSPSLEVRGGFVEVNDNRVTVCVEP